MIRSCLTEQNNGYVTAVLIEPDGLPVGNGSQSTYNNMIVAKQADLLPTGNGTINSAIVNGYNTLAVVFDADSGNLEAQVNGYNAIIVKNYGDVIEAGSGLEHTFFINGENSFVINSTIEEVSNLIDNTLLKDATILKD